MEGKNIAQKEINKELKDFLDNVHLSNKFRKYGWMTFGTVFLLAKLLNLYPISWAIVCILFLMLFQTISYDFLVKRTGKDRTLQEANYLYFVQQLAELLLIFTIIHIAGVAPLMGTFILADYLFTAYFVYTQKKYYWSILFFSLSGYIVLITLEYLGIMAVGDVLNIGVPITGNQGFFMVGLIPNLSFLIFLFLLINFFAERLRRIISELTKKENELNEAKEILEVKINARTKALEEQKSSLEEKVKDRTRELQDKIDEMEKFQKIAIGRELKMIELKKEIEEIKKKEENNKK